MMPSRVPALNETQLCSFALTIHEARGNQGQFIKRPRNCVYRGVNKVTQRRRGDSLNAKARARRMSDQLQNISLLALNRGALRASPGTTSIVL